MLLLVVSCSAPRPPVLPLCPPTPIPICKPGTFNQILLDTTEPKPGHLYTHISQLPKAMNSDADDNSIVFVPSAGGRITAVVSSDRRVSPDENLHSIQRMWSARFGGTLSYGPVGRVEEEATPLPCGAGTFCAADGKFYFTAKAENDDPDDFDLYVATIAWAGGEVMHLTHVERLPNVNQEHMFDGQPTLTPDGKTLYFTSDRPGGEGGTDIWYSTRSSAAKSDWSVPLPLPSPINTPCDEISPSVSPDGKTLYFSSNGHATVGGYDIFKCKRVEASGADEAVAWSEPQNLGKPINTIYDEAFPTELNDTAFFYCSNQPSNIGGRNLYTLTYSRPPFPQGATVVERKVKTVDSVAIHDSIFKALANVPVKVTGHVDRPHQDSTELFVNDPSTNKQLADQKIGPSGNFVLYLNRGKQYDVGVKNEQSFYDVKRIDLRNSIDTAIGMTLALPDTLIIRLNFPFDDHQHPYEFVFGDSGQQLNVTWERSLDLVAESANSALAHLKSIVLIGHTDSMGTDEYNQLLGLRRATFVAQQLIARGVPKKLIVIESRGRTMPVERRPGESDDTFRLRSRRVEFVKVFLKQ